MLQNVFILEQMSRQVQQDRIMDANRVRVHAILHRGRMARKAPER